MLHKPISINLSSEKNGKKNDNSAVLSFFGNNDKAILQNTLIITLLFSRAFRELTNDSKVLHEILLLFF